MSKTSLLNIKITKEQHNEHIALLATLSTLKVVTSLIQQDVYNEKTKQKLLYNVDYLMNYTIEQDKALLNSLLKESNETFESILEKNQMIIVSCEGATLSIEDREGEKTIENKEETKDGME